MSTNNIVLVLGTSEVGKDFLVKRILSQNLNDSIITYRSNKKIKKTTWKVDTRYYTADLDFLIENTSCPSIDFTKNGECQGIILVINPSQPSSFDSLKPITEDIFSRYDPSIRICIGNQIHSNTKENDCLIKNVSSWCLENNVEYINIAYNCVEKLEEKDLREKFGISRLIEVLHANMWNSLSLKTNPKTPNVIKKNSGEKKKRRRKKKKSTNSSIEPKTSSEIKKPTSDIEKGKRKKEKSYKNKNKNTNNTDIDTMQLTKECTSDPNSNHIKNNQKVINSQNTEDDIMFGENDNFENLIEEIKTVRENVKNQEMNDTERRKAAENAVMKIYKILGDE